MEAAFREHILTHVAEKLKDQLMTWTTDKPTIFTNCQIKIPVIQSTYE